jgi:hypothetical protein
MTDHTGGKYVARGSYGCTFAPAISCSSKVPKGTYTRSVGKLFYSGDADNSAQDELVLARKVTREIDPQGTFTVKLRDQCKITKPKGTDLAGAPSMCRFYPGDGQLIYDNGGISLEAYVKVNRGKPSAMIKLVKNSLPVLEGMKIMVDKQLTHTDIKPENLLIQGRKVLMIDFGLMAPFDETLNRDWLMNHNYRYYPVEFKLFNHYAVNFTTIGSSLPRLQKIMGQNFPNGNAVYNIFGVNLQSELKEMAFQCDRMFKQYTYEDFEEFMKVVVLPKCDLFAYGTSLAEIYVNLTITAKSKSDLKKLAAIRQFLRLLILPNSMKRPSLDEAISMLKDLIIIL